MCSFDDRVEEEPMCNFFTGPSEPMWKLARGVDGSDLPPFDHTALEQYSEVFSSNHINAKLKPAYFR